MDAFRAQLAKAGFVATRVPVLEPRFAGKVAILVDGATASACEPLVHLLKKAKRARVFGDTTAGAMLSSDDVDLGDGWRLRIPTADYVTADGVRLEKRGVEPDVAVEPEEAERAAVEWLRAKE